MRLILLGPPGSGKGTQAEKLCAHFSMVHISTGDILRDAIRRQTPLGQQAEPYLTAGQLVPDQLVNDMVADRFQGPNRPQAFLMDGYPRTVAQAEAFDRVLAQVNLPVDAAVVLKVSDEEIVRRISGRRVCPSTGLLYHIVFNPPKVPDRDDVTGEPLEQRADDREDTVRKRLSLYRSATVSVLQYYRDRQLLIEIEGKQSVDAVFQCILQSLPVSR